MQKKQVCIVIPIYQKISDQREILSLKQGLKIFANHPIIFICPQSFDQSCLDQYLESYSNITFERFDDGNFKSVITYDRMLLDGEFYKKFQDYEFMLIYQTDAYVFEDQLIYWCNKGFDFIGAPWFKKFDASGKEKEFITVAGNGGFSLRNISKINELMAQKLTFEQMVNLRNILAKTRIKSHKRIVFTVKFFARFFHKKNSFAEICSFICRNATSPHEDYFFASTLPQIFPDFISAKALDAISFAFEAQPENLYKINGEKLPFGCHAWTKYSPDFWKKFINF